MNRLPRFSVIIPAFNTAAYIGEAIESVRRQTVPDWELVVVDDGSPEDDAGRAAAFADPRIRIIRQENRGQTAARNRGAAEGRGEYFLFLDADDRLRPDALERLGALLTDHPEVDMVYGELVTIDEAGRIRLQARRPVFGPRPSGRILADLLAGGFIVSGMALLRAAAFRQLGGFDEDLRLADDWELWCRMAARSEILYLGGEPVFEYRLRLSSATHVLGVGEAGFLERRRVIDRVYDNPAVTAGFTPGELARLRRRRYADAYARGGGLALRGRDWSTARHFFWSCLKLNPARPREVILLAFSLLRWLPPAVERRLK